MRQLRLIPASAGCECGEWQDPKRQRVGAGDGPAAAIIQAGVQFSVAEAMAGDQVTLKAGPANVGNAASGQVNNVVTLAAGLAPVGTAGKRGTAPIAPELVD